MAFDSNDDDSDAQDARDARRSRASRDSRPPRLASDPDKYIRRIRGGRYQARPYDEGERFNLGTFATVQDARAAIKEFWRRSVGELPKHTHRVMIDGVEKFMVRIKFEGDGWTYQLGPYDTREQAGAAAAGLCLGLYGPLFGEVATQRIDHFLPWSRKLERRLLREKQGKSRAVA